MAEVPGGGSDPLARVEAVLRHYDAHGWIPVAAIEPSLTELAAVRGRLAETEAELRNCQQRIERQRIELADANRTNRRGNEFYREAAEALRVERDTAVDALRLIASGEFVTKAVSDPIPTVIDGKETTVTYAERLTSRQIAQRALAAVGGPTAA